MFNDTITLFNKVADEWTRTVIHGVQWSDKTERTNDNGKISVATYAIITFPQGTYEGLVLDASKDEDGIFYGDIIEMPIDARGYRLSDMLEKYPKSGRIQAVNDNSNRTNLKNIKVVVG